MKAQNKFTLEDVTPGGKTYEQFVPKNLAQVHWNGSMLCYVENDSLIGISFPSNKKKLLFSLQQLNNALKVIGVDQQRKIPSISFYDREKYYFQLKDKVFVYDLKQLQVILQIKLPKGSKNFDFCVENKCFACTSGRDLYVTHADSMRRINPKAEKNIVYGQAAHRNEFGIQRGTFWSPKGRYLAFYRTDESQIVDYEQVDSSKKTPQKKIIKYPFAGTATDKVSIGIYDTQKDTVTYLPTDNTIDRYFTNLAWTPDERELLVAELNREQDTCEIKAYNIKNRKVRTLFTETSITYVEPEQPPFFIDNHRFIWQSERTGHNHLYRYHLKNNSCKAITSGEWDVLKAYGYDEQRDKLIFAANINSPLEKNLYQVSVASSKIEFLSSEPGQHTAQLSPSGQYVLDTYSNSTIPRKIDVINRISKKSGNILSATNPYVNRIMPKMLIGKIKAADDSTDLYYRLTLPVNFNPEKKYPVIVVVYGGPHVQLVQNVWLGGSRGWEMYLAQQGYICFTLDNRGSANRGQAFEQVIYKQVGNCEVADQLRGVEFLKHLPYVDATRMGVYGWSFGGFMVTSLLCRYPDVFKVGVAGGAVTDWSLYEAMYGERYMQTPEKNPQGYAQSNVSNYVQNLQAKLLLIHGELDPIVVIEHAQQFIKAAENNKKNIDVWFYQKHGHNINGKDRVGLFERITKYFEDNL
jgi:dipeptidyl aminopeptidase/acylaminoacyl peptidase